jgi:hypothetical protein
MTASQEYIAFKMNTKYPILPIHTTEEKELFKELFHSNPVRPLKDYVEAFLCQSDGQKIFYKSELHIKNYKRDYLASRNAFNSTLPFIDARDALRAERASDPVVRASRAHQFQPPIEEEGIQEEEAPFLDAFDVDPVADEAYEALLQLQSIVAQEQQEAEPPTSLTVESITSLELGPPNHLAQSDVIRPPETSQSQPSNPLGLVSTQPTLVQPLPPPAPLPLPFVTSSYSSMPFPFPVDRYINYPSSFPSMANDIFREPIASVRPVCAVCSQKECSGWCCPVCKGKKCPGTGYMTADDERFHRRCFHCDHTGCPGLNKRDNCKFRNNPLPGAGQKRPRRK